VRGALHLGEPNPCRFEYKTSGPASITLYPQLVSTAVPYMRKYPECRSTLCEYAAVPTQYLEYGGTLRQQTSGPASLPVAGPPPE
jgi:hypothetical protein